MRWPEGPLHLALNAPYFVLVCFVFKLFPFSCFSKKSLFSPEKGHFCRLSGFNPQGRHFSPFTFLVHSYLPLLKLYSLNSRTALV